MDEKREAGVGNGFDCLYWVLADNEKCLQAALITPKSAYGRKSLTFWSPQPNSNSVVQKELCSTVGCSAFTRYEEECGNIEETIIVNI